MKKLLLVALLLFLLFTPNLIFSQFTTTAPATTNNLFTGGKVGIGFTTTAPLFGSEIFKVNGSAFFSGPVISDSGFGSGSNGTLVFRANGSFAGHIATYNTSFGITALENVVPNYTSGDGLYNSAFGAGALNLNSTGRHNSAFGLSALQYSTTGNNNSAFGSAALLFNKTGYDNSAFGTSALARNISGYYNCAFGQGSSSGNLIGNYNSSFGHNSLSLSEGSYNSAFGASALGFNKSGELNVGFGMKSLELNTTGSFNSAVGSFSLNVNTTGTRNTALGYQSGGNLLSGDNNLFLGAGTLPNISSYSSNQINIANAIYGFNKNIGIGALDPQNKLEIKSATLDTSGLRFTNLKNTSPSTTNATNKILSVNTTGDVILVDDKVGTNIATTNLLTFNTVNNQLTSTVNGIASTTTLPTQPNTNTLTLSNTGLITSNVNGASSSIQTANSLQLNGNILTSTVNGVSSNQITLPTSTTGPNTSGWLLTGNALTTGNEFLGTTDINPLVFKAHGVLAGNLTWTTTSFGMFAGQSLNNSSNTSFLTNIGYQAGQSNSGNNNTCIGARTGMTGTGYENVFLGFKAGEFFGSGSGNLVMGVGAGTNYEGGRNIIMGLNAAQGGTDANNTTNGSENIFIGHAAGYSSRKGSGNVMIGNESGSKAGVNLNPRSYDSGDNNTFVGKLSGENNSGSNNCYFGHQTGQAIGYGSGNSAFGSFASASISGNQNAVFGQNAGSRMISGNNNLFLGANTNPNISNTSSNQVNIGNAIFGYNGNIGIGALNPQNKLEIAGGLSPSGLRFTSLTNTSPSTINATSKILSVNETGDVILVDDKVGANIATTNLLTLDTSNNQLTSTVNGVPSAVDLNFLIVPSSDTNIYNSDGSLQSERFVNLEDNNLHFRNSFTTSILSPTKFASQADSFSSLKMINEPNYQRPNLYGFGMSNISDGTSGISLTQGIDQSSTWIQSSRSSAQIFNYNEEQLSYFFRPRPMPLLLNPNRGNVGIGVLNPTAQLHTIQSVRFENLGFTQRNTSILTTDAIGNVTNRDAANLLTQVTTNTLTLSSYNPATGNLLTSNVNGQTSVVNLSTITPAVNNLTVSNTGLINSNINGASSSMQIYPSLQLNGNFLTSTVNGASSTPVNLSSLTTPSVNIYNSDGSLQSERFVNLEDNNLHFRNSLTTSILSPTKFASQADSFSSLKMINEPNYQRPNLYGFGMSNISDGTSGISLTQGIDQSSTWIQSSRSSQQIFNYDKKKIGIGFRPIPLPLLLNPNRGNVGIGVLNPTAQLHTINSVRFENLGYGYENTNMLTTDSSGNVSQRDFKALLYQNITNQLFTIGANNIASVVNGKFAQTKAINTVELSVNGTDLVSTVNGVVSNTVILPTQPTTNQLTSVLPNTIRSIVNGAIGETTAVNTVALSVNGTNLVSTVNGVASNTVILPTQPTSNTLTLSNTGLLTSNINGASSSIQTTNALSNNPATPNQITSNVNGVTSSANIINSLNTVVTGNQFSTVINGVSSSPVTIPQILEPVFVDSYVGTRLKPVDPLYTGFNIKKNSNNPIGFTATNEDATSNGAVALIGAGIGEANSYGTILAHFGANYYVPKFRANGALLTDKNLFVGTYGLNKTIDFVTGNSYTTTQSRFKIENADLSSLLYPNTRNDVPNNSPFNFIYTDVNGKFLSGPISSIINQVQITNELELLPGNILSSTVNGENATVNLSNLIVPSVNIYNSSGTLLANRTVAMDNKTLNFNFGSSPSNLSPNTIQINPTTDDSNLSVKVDRSDAPNLFGQSHTAIVKQNSTLSTGHFNDYFWLQASKYAGDEQIVGANYMINPIEGKVAIGTTNIDLDFDCPDCNDYRLFVKQGIRTEKVRVDVASVKGWADYVFDKNYNLMPLDELEKFILTNKHLPTVPKAEEVVKTGIDLGQMNSKLLEKVEELTLYTIDINKKNLELEKAKAKQDTVIQTLIERLEKLENKTKQ